MYLAVDIGGTKTLVATLDDNGVITQRVRFKTAQDYRVFIRNLSDSVGYLTTKTFVAAGVAAPGVIDHKKGVGIAMGNLPWKDVPLQVDVHRIAHAPTVLGNDAKLAGLSEAMLLKDAFKRVIYVTIGTGIGVGVIIDQKLDQTLIDTEPGQMLLEHRGKLQRWEDFASGRAIAKQFGKPASEITDNKDWEEIAHNLALGLIDLLAVVRADIMVVGGGIGQHFDRFNKPLTEALKSYETPLVPVPPIIKAQRPEDAVLYGCYDLAKSVYGKANR